MIDLHIHSNFSDGRLSVEEIIKEAIKNNIKVISITDHDNIESANYILENSKNEEIIIIPGVELSAVTYMFGEKLKIHLLGYGYDFKNKRLLDSIAEVYGRRYEDNKKYIDKLIYKLAFMSQDFFTDFDYGKYGWISRMIINQSLPYLTMNQIEELKTYLKVEKPVYNNYNFSIEEAVEIIKMSHGYTSLAHPFHIKLPEDNFRKLIQYLIYLGLDGLETFHNDSTEEERKKLHNDAINYRLYETGGSDFHTYDYDYSIGCDLKLSDCHLAKRIILEKKDIFGGKYDK